MNPFGLQEMGHEEPEEKQPSPLHRGAVLARGSDFPSLPQQWGPRSGPEYSRINKRQLYCRRCQREVEKTEQTGLQAGRRIICCRFYCHGDYGDIQICDDQLESRMVFEVFEGQPALRAPQKETPALPDRKAGGPVEIDVEVEVTRVDDELRLQAP